MSLKFVSETPPRVDAPLGRLRRFGDSDTKYQVQISNQQPHTKKSCVRLKLKSALLRKKINSAEANVTSGKVTSSAIKMLISVLSNKAVFGFSHSADKKGNYLCAQLVKMREL